MLELIQLVGLTGQLAFFSRFLVQWVASERAGRSVAPVVFWWLSLIGCAGVGAYTLDRGEPVLLVGITVNGVIYARNLWIALRPGETRWPSPVPLAIGVGIAAVILFASGILKTREGWSASHGWLACAVVGQGIWSSRFVLQWWFSERRRRSHFPLAFWWLSLFGNLALLAYTTHLRDPILIAGFVPGPVVQVRNLVLSYRERRSASSPSAAADGPRG